MFGRRQLANPAALWSLFGCKAAVERIAGRKGVDSTCAIGHSAGAAGERQAVATRRWSALLARTAAPALVFGAPAPSSAPFLGIGRTARALMVAIGLLGSAVTLPAWAQHPPRVVEQFKVGPNVYVRALAVDAAGRSLWVGTSGGVHEVDLDTQALRRTLTREQGLANEYVFAIRVDRNGDKWFGTNAGGVSRLSDGRMKTWFPMHGLADFWVYAFAEQNDGTLWIGTWDGASRYDAASDRFTNFTDELINEWVYGISVDAQDRVWFATEGGVSMLEGETWRHWSHDDGLGAGNEGGLAPSKNTGLGTRSRHDLGILRGGAATYNPSYVFAIHVDRKGAVWAGTWGGGASRFDGEQWRNYTTRDGLAGDIVYSIAEDEDGVLWFGTDAGLSRFDGNSWHTISVKDGLIESHVYAVAIAPKREIWAGTRGGVVRIVARERSKALSQTSTSQ